VRILPFIGIILWLLLIWACVSRADDVALVWDSASQANGVTGYKMYYGTGSRDYVAPVDAGGATSGSVRGLDPSVTYYFAITVYNASGNESDFSSELIWDNVPPTLSWAIDAISISYSPWRLVMPDLRPFLQATDDVSPATSLSVTQAPSPGTILTGPGEVRMTATDEAGNTTTSTSPFTVSASFEARVTAVRLQPITKGQAQIDTF